MVKTMSHFEGNHDLKEKQRWSANFYIDTFGELKRFKPTNSMCSTMLNMASFMARGSLKRFK